MIVDHTHKYIVVSTPKTGSISIQFSLGYGHDIPEPHLYHASIADIIAKHPDCENYFKFAVVRNPWARLVSLYFDFTKKRIQKYSQLVQHEQPLLHEFKDFNDLCLRLHETAWKDDLFFQSQFKLLSIDGKLALDMVGRFENLEEDFKAFCIKVGVVPPVLEKHNLGVYDNTSYRQYYTDEARSVIGELYLDDIKEFGYEF